MHVRVTTTELANITPDLLVLGLWLCIMGLFLLVGSTHWLHARSLPHPHIVKSQAWWLLSATIQHLHPTHTVYCSSKSCSLILWAKGGGGRVSKKSWVLRKWSERPEPLWECCRSFPQKDWNTGQFYDSFMKFIFQGLHHSSQLKFVWVLVLAYFIFCEFMLTAGAISCMKYHQHQLSDMATLEKNSVDRAIFFQKVNLLRYEVIWWDKSKTDGFLQLDILLKTST